MVLLKIFKIPPSNMDFGKCNYNKYLVVEVDENKLSLLVIMAYRKILLFFFIYFEFFSFY